MENDSNLTSHDHANDVTHSATHASNIAATFISMYLLIATLYYAVERHSAAKRLQRVCNVQCTCASFLLAVQTLLVEINVHKGETRALCALMSSVQNLIATATRALVFSGLWMRQNAVAGGGGGRKPMTSSVLAAIVVTAIVQGATRVVGSATSIVETTTGCFMSTPRPYVAVIASMVTASWSCIQFVLLRLTTRPLVRQIEVEKRMGRSAGRLRAVVIRLRACACVCILADLSFLVAFHVFRQIDHLNHLYLSSNYNLITYLLATLLSFIDYRQRIFPFCTDFSSSSSSPSHRDHRPFSITAATNTSSS